MGEILAARGISFAYPRQKRLFENIDLTLRSGEMTGIVGLSGCGKSTLVKCLCGIIPKLISGDFTGQVLVRGNDIRSLRLPEIGARIGVVFQNPDTQLFFSTVEDEIAFGPENMGLHRSEIARRVESALEQTGITSLRDEHPHQLSGGQKQLVALAAVLSLEPDVLIFDEAVSQVDDRGKALVQHAMSALKTSGRALLAVEHDFDNLAAADTVWVMRQGRLEPFAGVL